MSRDSRDLVEGMNALQSQPQQQQQPTASGQLQLGKRERIAARSARRPQNQTQNPPKRRNRRNPWPLVPVATGRCMAVGCARALHLRAPAGRTWSMSPKFLRRAQVCAAARGSSYVTRTLCKAIPAPLSSAALTHHHLRPSRHRLGDFCGSPFSRCSRRPPCHTRCRRQS